MARFEIDRKVVYLYMAMVILTIAVIGEVAILFGHPQHPWRVQLLIIALLVLAVLDTVPLILIYGHRVREWVAWRFGW